MSRQHVETLTVEPERPEKVFAACHILMRQFNAWPREILHVEGHDYQSHKPASRATIGRGAACAQR